ncbi:MAG: inorganic phosphate transporter [Acetobacteraceae bacterium]|nr:inorganic phosphate transporter [Acetobacteraceae bacterium]
MPPSSIISISLLAICLLLVFAFEATNGFHDAANAVATVIYTNSLKSIPAVVWSGIMNFIGVIVGGISVAYALVELLPPDVLSPPDGSPAVTMLVSLFVSACFWNLATWYFAIPNSSSHCIIGALVGVAIGNALHLARDLGKGIDWGQVWKVLEALALSPVLGFVLAGGLYFLARHVIRDRHLYEPPKEGQPPVWWLRGLLILTCTGVSFAHGTNDGQKSIGLIMLVIIGLFPATYALNPTASQKIIYLDQDARAAVPLIQKFGDDEKDVAVKAAQNLQNYLTGKAGPQQASADDLREASSGVLRVANRTDGPADQKSVPVPEHQRSSLRSDAYRVISEMKEVERSKEANPQEKIQATTIHQNLSAAVEYAPWWVRILSALCLGIGTMVGYKRIVHTLGERVGRTHLTPAKGAAAELIAAALISTAGFSGMPVSTAHIVTAGIAGTMAGDRGEDGGGLNKTMVWRIVAAWAVTLPVTIAIAGGLFYVLN